MHIQWPAILIHAEQAELIYLESERDWLLETYSPIERSCRLLDISGATFRVDAAQPTQLTQDKQPSWQLSDKALGLPQILDLVRQHASVSGHCCTAKLTAESLEQVFEIVKFLEEN